MQREDKRSSGQSVQALTVKIQEILDTAKPYFPAGITTTPTHGSYSGVENAGSLISWNCGGPEAVIAITLNAYGLFRVNSNQVGTRPALDVALVYYVEDVLRLAHDKVMNPEQ